MGSIFQAKASHRVVQALDWPGLSLASTEQACVTWDGFFSPRHCLLHEVGSDECQ